MAQITNRFLDQINTFDVSTLSQDESDAARVAALADTAAAVAAVDQAAAQATAFAILQSSSIVSNLVPGGVFAPDGSNLTSVDDILSPVTLKGDRFTASLSV